MFAKIKRKKKLARPSLRFEIVDGAVRRYPDGREVCLDTAAGKAEYLRRTYLMLQRQDNRCSRGSHPVYRPTFDHSTNSRGMGGGNRDDRIVDTNGEWLNSCSCFSCNGAAGSRRL